jgi:hypothetical protein
VFTIKLKAVRAYFTYEQITTSYLFFSSPFSCRNEESAHTKLDKEILRRTVSNFDRKKTIEEFIVTRYPFRPLAAPQGQSSANRALHR